MGADEQMEMSSAFLSIHYCCISSSADALDGKEDRSEIGYSEHCHYHSMRTLHGRASARSGGETMIPEEPEEQHRVEVQHVLRVARGRVGRGHIPGENTPE